MISNHIKDFIEDIIKEKSYKNEKGKEVIVVRNKRDEDNLKSNKGFPFFSLLTATGCIEEKGISNNVEWREDGKLWKAYIRAILKLPLEIRVFASSEEEANKLLFDVVKYIPDKWQLGNYVNKIELGEVVISDWANTFIDCTFASVFVNFFIDIATDKEEVKTIGKYEYKGD